MQSILISWVTVVKTISVELRDYPDHLIYQLLSLSRKLHSIPTPIQDAILIITFFPFLPKLPLTLGLL